MSERKVCDACGAEIIGESRPVTLGKGKDAIEYDACIDCNIRLKSVFTDKRYKKRDMIDQFLGR